MREGRIAPLCLTTEATLQGEFYHAARLLEMQCVLELSTPFGRPDAAILNAARTHLLAVVEVKKARYQFAGGRTAQIARYKRLCVPVYGLDWSKDPHRLAASIKRQVAGMIGIPLLSIADCWPTGAEICQRIKRRRERENQRAHERYLKGVPDEDLIVRK